MLELASFHLRMHLSMIMFDNTKFGPTELTETARCIRSVFIAYAFLFTLDGTGSAPVPIICGKNFVMPSGWPPFLAPAW